MLKIWCSISQVHTTAYSFSLSSKNPFSHWNERRAFVYNLSQNNEKSLWSRSVFAFKEPNGERMRTEAVQGHQSWGQPGSAMHQWSLFSQVEIAAEDQDTPHRCARSTFRAFLLRDDFLPVMHYASCCAKGGCCFNTCSKLYSFQSVLPCLETNRVYCADISNLS